MNLPALFLAITWPDLSDELYLLVGAGLTVLGTMLQWQVPRQRISAEDRVKDGKQTEAQAARTVRFYAISAPVLTVTGAALMLWVLVRFLR